MATETSISPELLDGAAVARPRTLRNAGVRHAFSRSREPRKSMVADAIYPIEDLRRGIEAFDVERALCLSAPEPKCVHRLRTLSRRVEALLSLVDSLPETPKHKKEARQVRRELKQVRRRAGDVRDLDVQRQRIADLCEGISTSGKGDAVKDALLEGGAALDAHLQGKRNRFGAALQARLQKDETRISTALGALLERLGEAQRLALSPEDLLLCAESRLATSPLLKKHLKKTLTEEELHSLRKAAKSARYLAELMPEHHAVRHAAKQFEALQDAGGTWHDDLDLVRAAKRLLGKKHALTSQLLSEQDRNLRLYREALRAEARRLGPPALQNAEAAA